MSYVLKIWEPLSAFPNTVADANRLLNQLHATHPGQNPKFTILAERLTQRFPCICSEEAESMPEWEWAWSDGPLTGKTGDAVWGVGLNLARFDEVRPFVIEQANALDLAVVDEQAGSVYLPNGKVLRGKSAPARTIIVQNYDDVPKGRDLGLLVFERLTPILQPYGYKPRKSRLDFKSVFPNGWHEIKIDVMDQWPLQCQLDLHVLSRFNPVTDLMASLVWTDWPPENIKAAETTVLTQCQWIGKDDPMLKGAHYYYVIQSYTEIDALMAHMVRHLETALLPILQKYQTIEGVDELMNPEPISSSIFFLNPWYGARNILSAYLAGNPRLNTICEQFSATIENAKPTNDYSINFAKGSTKQCIDYVRSKLANST